MHVSLLRGHKTGQPSSSRVNVAEPTPAQCRPSWSLDDSSVCWSLTFSFHSPLPIGQSRHVFSWLIYCGYIVVRCSCVVDPYSMLCIIVWAGDSLILMWSLSTWSSRHPDVEVVCYYCHRSHCCIRRLGRAPFAHSCLKPMHRRYSVSPTFSARVRLQCCNHWRSDTLRGCLTCWRRRVCFRQTSW